MTIRAFGFEAEATAQFVDVGAEARGGDPSLTPIPAAAVRTMLAPGFDFYNHQGHEHRRFLALVDGRPVARVLASTRPDLRDRDGAPVGALGFFDSHGDSVAEQEILQAAIEWLAQQGRRRVWGPLQFDIWHGYRFMTRGFGETRHLGEPRNPPDHPEAFDRLGFRPRQRWHSFRLPGREGLGALAAALGSEAGQALPDGYHVETFRGRPLEESLRDLHAALSDSFARFLGFTAIDAGEFRRVLGPGAQALDPDVSLWAFGPEGAIVAFQASFRDLEHASPGRRLLIHLGGRTSHADARRPGLAALVARLTFERAAANGWDEVLATLVSEGNPVRRYFGHFAEDARREYTLFQLDTR